MSSLHARLVAAENTFQEICSVTGNAGLVVGVCARGQVVYRGNFGYKDVASKAKPDYDTIFHIGSLTKGIVASGLAHMVKSKQLQWDSRLKELVPEYNREDLKTDLNNLKTDANLTDILAHRLGITTANGYWVQQHQQLLVNKKDTPEILASLKPANDFRSVMTYSNWSYALAGEILERLSSQSLNEYLTQYLFEPLGLTRTTLADVHDENYATSYITLPDRTPLKVPHPPLTDGKVLAGAGSTKSSLNDLLHYYAAILDSAKLSSNSPHHSTFPELEQIWTPQIPIDESSSYGLGWVLAELPGKAGLVGVNAYETPGGTPTICKGILSKQKLIYHNGAMAGALSAVYLLPESEIAVVVLGNTFSLCDTPDWIAQYIMEIITECPETTDFVLYARKAAENSLSHHPATQKLLEDERIPGTSPRDLHLYTGKYKNALGNLYLDIQKHEDGLHMTVQGYPQVRYDLYHYHHDVFAWDCDREAETKKTIFPQWKLEFHRIGFKANSTGTIEHLEWGFDGISPTKETFWKE